MDLSRREAVHWLTVLVGGAISAPTLSAIAAGCRAGPRSASWTPQVLDAEQLALLEALVDRIIPPTDTPGANEAGVAVFIDELLSAWVDPEERDRFLRGLEATGLGQATPEEQDAVLARLDAEAVRARAARQRPLPFFATLKEWTLVGYYTSEVGATRELQWLAAPGRYDGDLPLTEVGPTWA